MQFLACHVTNFGSYKELNFDFSAKGLTLIYGPTGSGKSTLLDIPAWILYGITAKDGTVDEVRSWQNRDECTIGTQEVKVGEVTLTITRVRGKPSENDLYWLETNSNLIYRGKDITETQKLLETRLGVTSELYVTSSYFHEFSSTFFTDKAKDKRDLFERIACLDLPLALSERVVVERKSAKKTLSRGEVELARLLGKYENLTAQNESTIKSLGDWEESNLKLVEELKYKSSKFEIEKATKIEAIQLKLERFFETTAKELDAWSNKHVKLTKKLNTLDTQKCKECGKSDFDSDIQVLQYRINEATNEIIELKTCINPFIQTLEDAKNQKNHYDVQVKDALLKINPFGSTLVRIHDEMPGVLDSINLLERSNQSLRTNLNLLDQLYDLSFDLRGKLLKTAIKDIETKTNEFLTKYFEAEIKVKFSILESDIFDVEIEKSGYTCTFTQLSKGQKGLLKLCFSVAVMNAASSRAGIHFSNLFFDEALDGLDSEMKVKAFSLFSDLELNHQSIFLIDHEPGFQNLFTNKFKVHLDGEASSIEECND